MIYKISMNGIYNIYILKSANNNCLVHELEHTGQVVFNAYEQVLQQYPIWCVKLLHQY